AAAGGARTFHLLRGRLLLALEHADAFRRRVSEDIRRWREDADLVRDAGVRRAAAAWEAFLGRLERASKGYRSPSLLWPVLPGVEIRPPTVVVAVRGTRVAVRQAASGATEVAVLDGRVEVTPAGGGAPVIVEAGRRLVADAAGGLRVEASLGSPWWRELP
ncbi:FecR domain-containing protein, partial [Dissulfurirhabdus thermomarina]|nr:FecR domain-containing protein [Dissulfurirhabdus thermomarina]